jgi:hypothetical protein
MHSAFTVNLDWLRAYRDPSPAVYIRASPEISVKRSMGMYQEEWTLMSLKCLSVSFMPRIV